MKHIRRFTALVLIPLLLGCASDESRDLGDQRVLVNEAAATTSRLLNDPQFGDLRDYIHRAKAVLIIPNMYRAGFVLGAEYGKGVLMVKTDDGGGMAAAPVAATAPTTGIQTEDLQSGATTGTAAAPAPMASTSPASNNGGGATWGNPLFYKLTGGSFGLQIGGQAAETIITIMTDKGLHALLNNSVKLGGDLSIAVGPIGQNVAASTGVMPPSADMYTFGSTVGLYGGMSLTGAVLSEYTDWNMLVYGASAVPKDVMMRSDSPLAEAQNLRTALNQ